MSEGAGRALHGVDNDAVVRDVLGWSDADFTSLVMDDVLV